ncbi:hypothetical protein ACFVU3_33080 [Streptomyces sp. NPDC058052]|uniref:hypothetical protein n=1 Tax=Streptomyces sp. NPDC058052 TaxID=3346316 RepID=UPI0036EB79B8
MTQTAWTPRTRPADAPDPLWWVAPLAGTLGAPVLLLLTGSTVELLSAHPVVIAVSFLVPLLVALPGWFLARTTRRRRTRIGLAGLACAIAAAYPQILGGLGVVVLLVMLVTGNASS